MTDGHLVQVAQRVTDLDRAVQWYETVARLPLVARFDEAGIAFFDLGGVRLMLGPNSYSSSLYLRVDDIDTTVGRLVDQGVDVEQGPTRVHVDADGTFGAPGTEEWMAFVHDSEDNLVAFVERRAPSPS